MNEKWYYLINLADKTASELMQIPEVWGNTTGLNSVDDATLADMNWSGQNVGFLSESAALAFGVSQAELDKVKPIGAVSAKEWIRGKRDVLLAASDAAVMPDRWESYDSNTKTIISQYRQALRDMTGQSNVFEPTWPVIPNELEFLKKLDI